MLTSNIQVNDLDDLNSVTTNSPSDKTESTNFRKLTPAFQYGLAQKALQESCVWSMDV